FRVPQASACVPQQPKGWTLNCLNPTRQWDIGLWTFDFFTLAFGRYTSFMPKKAKSAIVTVGLVQMSCHEKSEVNLKKAIARIGDAAKKGAQIVCLQELFRSQYFS